MHAYRMTRSGRNRRVLGMVSGQASRRLKQELQVRRIAIPDRLSPGSLRFHKPTAVARPHKKCSRNRNFRRAISDRYSECCLKQNH
jgi:hypothetical protein